MSCRILVADALDGLKTLGADSVQCVVTSPPYWGQRDYKMAGQLGLEDRPSDYITNLVRVLTEVRRTLHPAGVVWLVLGDCYSNRWACKRRNVIGARSCGKEVQRRRTGEGLKDKDLVGIPWRVALALQADGWWLRQEIIWNKPNVMPESAKDRCTRSHETIFMLSRNERYYYDGAAIAAPCESGPSDLAKMAEGLDRIGGKTKNLVDAKAKASGATNIGRKRAVGGSWPGIGSKHGEARARGEKYEPMQAHPNRNARSVWTIATVPYPGEHTATYPPELARRCILAGSRPADTVLDPFMGAGTTGLVARQLGRSCIGIELNPKYAQDAKHRIEDDCPLFESVELLTGGD